MRFSFYRLRTASHTPLFFLYPQQRVDLRRYSGAPLEARLTADGQAGHCRRPAAETPVPTGRSKRGQGHRMVPLPPLDSPKPSFEPLSEAFAAKRGLRGLGSVRRADFGKPYCPEFSLRQPPRITVRGQTVQGVGLALRKALLQSRMIPWSTRRPCGPLVFRRATGGSRVQRKGWGVKRGRETLVSLPLLSLPGDPGIPCRRRRPMTTPSEGVKSPPAARRCIGGKAHPLLRDIK